MRLWHKDLIDVLPRQQLLAQWRELNSIYKKQDNHILINFIYGYPKEQLLFYSDLIINEFDKRGYKIRNVDNYKHYFADVAENALRMYGILHTVFIYSQIYPKKMDEKYLRQCLYNLEEKAMCGGITKEEWKKIYNKYKDRFVLWEGDE